MSMTIGRKISLGFAGVVVLAGALGVFGVIELRGIREDAATVRTATPGLTMAMTMEERVRLNYGLLLEHILASTPTETEGVEREMAATSASLSETIKAYEAQMDNDEERSLFGAINAARVDWQAKRDAVMELSRADKKDDAEALLKRDVMPIVDRYTEATQKLATFNEDATGTAVAEIESAVSTATTALMVGVCAAVLIGAGCAFMIIRGINRVLTRIASTLGAGGEQVSSASSQVAGSSQSLAQGASEQAAALEETTSALEEMSSMTKKNAETAQQAAAISAEAKAAADRGNEAMIKMGAAIDEIQKSATETSKIIKTIDEIAFQTNLLALNAAVEAARAGEAGKGFAVVAEEVRNLAMRSAEAAKNTSSLIEESVNNAKNGVAISTEVAKTLEEITGASAKVNSLVDEISAASREQSQGIGQVNTSVGQMDKATQSAAANAEESAAAAEELSSQAEQLNGIVGDLVQLVTGARNMGTATTTHAQKRSTSATKPAGFPKAKSLKPAAAMQIPLDNDERGMTGSNDFSEFGKAA